MTAAERAGGTSGIATEALETLRSAGRTIARRDVSVSAAQLTYFASIAIVPWLLLACWSTTWFTDTSEAERRLLDLRSLVPPDMGARGPFATLVTAGTGLGVGGALVTVLPASFYGEGIRRGCLSLLPAHDRLTGWQARLWMLPLLVLVAPLSIAVIRLSSGPLDLAGREGLGARLLLIVVEFTITWLALTAPLTWVFRQVAPGHLRWTSAGIGALATAAFLAGFLQGFLLFLSIPIDLGVPFGGLDVVGGVVAVGFWLFLLHLVLLVGWVLTVELDDRLRAAREGKR
ncbi:YhjD/YihY/BrkB family envelope integrity protein [Aeromicrobium chenweiae]|uniref:YhjD/YihY/BrkB family envelope integrity protein n=1 Tax=Aeromicrobium chenweiae TaxID=2079793 RepID=UPI0019021D60|nr:YhjD/YihY/BrkB family envelope integrity protein [Aeromicrobium chenweiae]